MAKDTFARTKPHFAGVTWPPINVLSVGIQVDPGESASVFFTFDSIPTTNLSFIVSGTTPVSPGISKPPSGAMKLLGEATVTDPGSSASLASGYFQRFGSPAEGETVFLQLHVIDQVSGAVLNVGTFKVVATAT